MMRFYSNGTSNVKVNQFKMMFGFIETGIVRIYFMFGIMTYITSNIFVYNNKGKNSMKGLQSTR